MVLLAGISIGCNCGVLSPMDASQIGFGNVGAQPNVIEVRKRNHRRARRNYFAEFSLPHSNYAGGRGTQDSVIEVDSRQAQSGIGCLNISVRNRDIFPSAAFESLVVALLDRKSTRLNSS